MRRSRTFMVILTAVIACLVYIWFAFIQQPAPRAVVWQDRVYVLREQAPIQLQQELVRTLKEASIGGKTFYSQRQTATGLVAPLELFFPAGDGRYHVYERDLDIDEQLVRKPNIYLYSAEPTAFTLKLALDGVLTASDPVYTPAGWNGVTYSDGMINRNIPYLFYEFATTHMFSQQNGWSIPTSEFAEWCKRELVTLGLNERERADFADYWLKVLPDSPFINIYLQPRSLVEKVSRLQVSPAPDAVLRLFFYVVPSGEYQEIPTPQTMPFIRQGFTLVEWGVILK